MGAGDGLNHLVRRVVVVFAAAVLSAGCGASTGSHSSGSQASSNQSGTDTFGDPYITDAQGDAVQIGASSIEVFAALGGRADSGTTGDQAGPTKCYDYPIRGTGNPDDVMDTSTIWWQICIRDEFVVSKQRGTMDNLP